MTPFASKLVAVRSGFASLWGVRLVIILSVLTIVLVGTPAHAQPSRIPNGAPSQAQLTPVASAPPPTAWLGVGFADAPQAILINEVIPDSPADLAGVLVDDLVYSVDQEAIRSGTHFQSLIQSHLVGDEVVLKIRRRSRVVETRAELTPHLDAQELIQRRLVDREAPEFILPLLDGTAAGSPAQNRGKVVVLHFWSTRCQQCTAVFESLAALQAENLGELEVLAVTADAASVVESFLNTYKLGVTVLHDPGFAVHAAYHYDNSLPTTVVIGKDGYVRFADTGPQLRIDDILLAAKRCLRERPSI